MATTIAREPLDIDEIVKAYNALADEIYKDLDKQYCEGKISGPKYADTWAALQQAAISGAFSAVVSIQTKETNADRCVKEEQCRASIVNTENQTKETDASVALKKAQEAEIVKESERKERLTTQQIAESEAKEAVLIRQEAGFDDNLRQKLFEAQMNAWALMFSSGLLEKMPCFIDSDEASKLYAGILNKTMPSYTPPDYGCEATTTDTTTS